MHFIGLGQKRLIFTHFMESETVQLYAINWSLSHAKNVCTKPLDHFIQVGIPSKYLMPENVGGHKHFLALNIGKVGVFNRYMLDFDSISELAESNSA